MGQSGHGPPVHPMMGEFLGIAVARIVKVEQIVQDMLAGRDSATEVLVQKEWQQQEQLLHQLVEVVQVPEVVPELLSQTQLLKNMVLMEAMAVCAKVWSAARDLAGALDFVAMLLDFGAT